DSALAPELQPSPKQPPGPPQAQTATRPTPLAASSYHRLSPPPATATHSILLTITAMTATSGPASAITPPIAATSAPAPATPIAPGLCQDSHHASQSRITADPTSARHTPLPLPSSPPCHCMSLHSQCETSALHNMFQPPPHPIWPPGLTPSSSATTCHWNPGLSPGAYLLRSI
ncbi:hypothetical protein C0993_003521, partial [Termitomyces sp. T159_Od127]